MHYRLITLAILIAQSSFFDAYIVPKLLLPYHAGIQVNYTIRAVEGCYSWKSIRPDVATIEPVSQFWNVDKQCSTAATVSVKSTQPTRKTTLVLATSADTGSILQCDVIVDKITMIDITSRTRELYLEDPPEKLKIRALDEDGNTFSSTAGMKFEWTLSQKNNSDEKQNSLVSPHSILRVQRFIDTKYEAEQYVTAIERGGKLSDTILVSGIQTGSAVVVSAIPTNSDMSINVSPASVQLVVKDKVMLNPGHDVYLLIYGTVQYSVERWRQGKPTKIKMPCQQYQLKTQDKEPIIENKPVVGLEQDTSILTALNNGKSEIILLDMHLSHHDEEIMEQARAGIYVVEPSYLTFKIEPHGNWIMQKGNAYTITVHLFDKDNEEIWPSNNIKIETFIDQHYFEVLGKTNNGTWQYIRAINVGSVDIISELLGIYKVGPSLSKAGLFSGSEEAELVLVDPPIRAVQNVQIFDKIEVQPELVIFPWHDTIIQYLYTFTATGGSGNYTWSVSNPDLASINFNGMVTLACGKGKNEGPREVKIQASDLRNSHHFGEALAVVTPPVKIEYSRSEREAELGTYLWIYLNVYAMINDTLLPVTDCSRLPNLEWEIKDTTVYDFDGKAESIRDPEDSKNLKACLRRKLKPLKEGYTDIKVNYRQIQYKEFNVTQKELSANTIITAYKPLRSIDPYKLAVVSLDATKLLKFEGGPIPWPTFPGSHVKVTSTNNDIVAVTPKISNKEHLFIGHCLTLGSTEVTLYVYNQPVKANFKPKNASITITVSCDLPAGVKLSANVLPDRCPLLNLRNPHAIVTKDQAFELFITAYDSVVNQFDNFTTLEQIWSSVPKGIKNVGDKISVIEQDENGQGKQKFVQEFKTQTVGEFTVKLLMKKYEDYVKNFNCITPDCYFEPAIESSIALQVVEPLKISKNLVTLFNNAEHAETIQIEGGSGYFDFIDMETNRKLISEIIIKERILHLTPLKVGRSRIKIIDLCISSEYANLDITVSDVASIFIDANNLLEIGSSSELKISIFDAFKSLLNDLLDSSLDITIITEPNDIISIDKIHRNAQDETEYTSRITGNKVGDVTIYATTYSRDGKRITSNKVSLTVFPPLELIPPVVRLVPGSVFNMRVTGGPPNDVSMVFGSEDEKVVTISHAGILEADALGNTQVWVKAITQDGKTFHCKKPATVYVVSLVGIRIHSPISRFYEDATVPLRVYGVSKNSNDPIDLSCENTGFKFKWRALNKAVLRLDSVHSDSNILITDELSFTVFAVGLTSGQSLVEVTLSSSNSKQQMMLTKLSAELQLTVYNPLAVTSSDTKKWATKHSYLVAPSAMCSIESNRDTKAKSVVYQLLSNCDKSHENDCIVINKDEHNFMSSDRQCETALKVTSVETFGVNQTVTIQIQVRAIAYIVARAKNKFYNHDSEKKLTGFPIDSDLEFEISMYDNTGSKFDCTSVGSQYLLSRNDLLQVSQKEKSLDVHASFDGVTIVKLWPYNKEKQEADNSAYHFPIPVNSVINPYKEIILTVGEKYCLVADVVNSDGGSGSWSTKSSKSFAVESNTGAVLAYTVAYSTVEYHLSSGYTTLPISSNAFYAKLLDTDLPGVITNAKEQYVFPFELQNSGKNIRQSCSGLETQMNQFSKEVFNCIFHIKDKNHFGKIFSTDVAYLSNINSYACIINALKLNDETALLMSTTGGEIIMSLQVKPNMLDRGSVFPSTLSIKFLPAFFVLKSEIKLTMSKNENALCVSACSEVFKSLKVQSEIDGLKITPDKVESDVQCYTLIPDRSIASSFTILISSNLVDQTETVKVIVDKTFPISQSYRNDDTECIKPTAGIWAQISDRESTVFWAVLIATLIIGLIIIFLIFRWGNTSNTHQPQNFYQPNLSNASYMDSANMSGHFSTTFGASPFLPRNSNYVAKSSPRNSPSPAKINLWSANYSPHDAHT